MANKALKVFNVATEIEFWLDGKQKENFVNTILNPIEKLKIATKQGALKNLIIFYLKCRLGLPLREKESDVSGLVYQKLILSFLNPEIKHHNFKLFDKKRNIILEANFEEKDTFLSIFRILDEYAKGVLINQYNLSLENIKDKIVIDGGANMGEFSIYCARLGAKKVYAFEPLSSTYEILKQQIALNELEGRVIPINKALGDKNEKLNIKFSDAGDSSASICLTTKIARSEIIEAIKLDDFIMDEKVGFIKLDVEGYEENVLLGAKRIIAKDKPILALSAYHKPTDKERLPTTILSIMPDYRIKLLQKAEPDFFCEIKQYNMSVVNWRELRKIIFCLLFAVGVSFLLIEVILRITNFNNLATFTIPCVRKSSVPGLYAELIPNCSSVGDKPYNYGATMHINSCGFRGSEKECGLLSSTTPSTATPPYIFVTGDSYTGAGNVNESDSYVKVAEKKVREDVKNAIFFNTGVSSASIDEKIAGARYFLNKYPARPSALVFQWLLNDYDPSVEFSPGKMTKFKIFLRKYLYTYRFIVYIKNRLIHQTVFSITTYAEELDYRKKEFNQEASYTKLKDKLCSFSQYLESQKIRRVFLNPTFQEMLTDWKDYDQTMENIDKRINAIAEECGWTVVWTTEEAKKYPIHDIVLDPTGDHHPNVLGNKIIGEVLGNTLKAIVK